MTDKKDTNTEDAIEESMSTEELLALMDEADEDNWRELADMMKAKFVEFSETIDKLTDERAKLYQAHARIEAAFNSKRQTGRDRIAAAKAIGLADSKALKKKPGVVDTAIAAANRQGGQPVVPRFVKPTG